MSEEVISTFRKLIVNPGDDGLQCIINFPVPMKNIWYDKRYDGPEVPGDTRPDGSPKQPEFLEPAGDDPDYLVFDDSVHGELTPEIEAQVGGLCRDENGDLQFNATMFAAHQAKLLTQGDE